MTEPSIIPIIDVAALFPGGDPAAARMTAARLGAACETIGFFAVTGHGVPDPVRQELSRQSYAFFDLPLSEKMRIKRPRPEQNRGYIATGDETLARLARRETPPDAKEIFAIGPGDVPLDEYHTVPDAYPSFAPNLWPEAAPGLEVKQRGGDTLIECLPSCRSAERPPRYEALTVQDCRTVRFARTAGLQKAG